MTVAELLDELNVKRNFYGILVDGKKATLETRVSAESEVIILPYIGGGTHLVYD